MSQKDCIEKKRKTKQTEGIHSKRGKLKYFFISYLSLKHLNKSAFFQLLSNLVHHGQ